MVDAKAIYLWTRAERRDEEDVSIDTSHTHSFSCLISAITCFCLSLQSAVLVVVLVAHLQLHLQHHASLACGYGKPDGRYRTLGLLISTGTMFHSRFVQS